MHAPIIRAEPLVDQVYKYLKNGILSGQIPVGQRIVERKLAEDLHISRSPIREALSLLAAEKLVISNDGTTHVFQPSFDDFLEIYELRLAVEPFTAMLAARRIEPETLAVLTENIKKTASCLDVGDTHELVVLNYEFHSQIWLASGNKRLYEILDNVSSVSHYYLLSVFKQNSEQSNVLAEHSAIYEALMKKDESAAYDAMQKNIVKNIAEIRVSYESSESQN